jgi:hypothetical protein
VSPRRSRLLLVLVTALVAAPFFLPGWLPLTDLPEHVAAMASIGHWGDPAYRIAEHYRIGWTTSQYLLVHLVGGGLAWLLGNAELAARIVLVVLAISWVESSRFLLRTFEVDERLAVMAALLFWNRALVVGFLPYLASLPLLFATLGWFVRADRGPAPLRRRRYAWLALAGVAVFYTHASGFVLLGAIAGALASTWAWQQRSRPLRVGALVADVVRRLLWLAPSAALALLWIARGRFGMHSSTIRDAGEVGTMSPLRAIKLIALYAHDTWTSHVDDWVGIGFWIIFLVLLVESELRLRKQKGEAARVGSLVPVAVAFLVYLATPFRVGTGVLLNVRMAPVLGLFALLGLRSVRGRLGDVAIVGAALLALVQCIDNVSEIVRLQRDVVGLPELLGTMRKGSRLITLNFSGFDREAAHFTPWLHVGSYHRARDGGVASFSFSELNHWSVQYRPEAAPPKQAELSWGMRPCLFRNSTDGPYFDYVLTRGKLDPFANDPPGPRWVVRGRTAKYTLYEKDPSRPPVPLASEPDEGPCPPRGHSEVSGATFIAAPYP